MDLNKLVFEILYDAIPCIRTYRNVSSLLNICNIECHIVDLRSEETTAAQFTEVHLEVNMFCLMIAAGGGTVDGSEIRRENHLRCMKPRK